MNDRRERPTETALWDNDVLRCGGCATRIGGDLVPASAEAWTICQACGLKNIVPLRPRARPSEVSA